MLLAISFFAFDYFFNSSNIKGIKFVHQNYAMRSPCSRAEEHRNSLLGPFIEKQHRVLGIHARLFARLRDFYAQYKMPSEILRNHKIQLFCSFQ